MSVVNSDDGFENIETALAKDGRLVNLRSHWCDAMRTQYPDRTISLELFTPEDISAEEREILKESPEFNYGDADVLVAIADLEGAGYQGCLPEPEIIDFVMNGMKQEIPDLKFVLDPAILPRPKM